MRCFGTIYAQFLVFSVSLFLSANVHLDAQQHTTPPLGGTSQAKEDDFKLKSRSLFDSQTLAGWEGNAYWFRIEEDSIVAGRSDEPIPHNFFLCTLDSFSDFDLRLEVKLVGKAQNAGVQFRSKRVGGSSEVSGYQADMGTLAGKSLWGSLYDESRRNKFLAEAGTAEATAAEVGHDTWTKVRILCQGDRIQIFINGVKTVDYTETDPTIPRFGVIGLQIHSGPQGEAWYRNLRLRSLL